MPTMVPIRSPRGKPSPRTTPAALPFSSRHQTALSSYNNKHKGQRGFLIGGGTSIKYLQESGFDFSQLKDEITVGVNKAYRLFIPTYLVFGDDFFWKHFSQEIRALQCIKFAPSQILRGYSDPSILPLRTSTNYQEVLPRGLDASVSFINNSGVAALRILYCLGCNPIYLFGIDLIENNIGETHFHNDYARFGRHTTPAKYKTFHTEFARTLSALKTKNISVFSCSEVSSLNTIIPYVHPNTTL